MGRRVFWTGVIAGAVIGGLTSLLNREAREYAKDVAQSTGETCMYVINHPDEAIRNVKNAAIFIEEKISENKSGAINALEQVENTLVKVSRK